MQSEAEHKSLTSIRGIAALYVLGYHLNQWVLPGQEVMPHRLFAYGYAAVDVFFILSGFILAAVYGRMALADTGDFLIRRVFRLYPLHLTIMAGLGALMLLASVRHIAMHSDANHSWTSFPYVLLLIHPFFDVPGEAGGWNSTTWSISVELLCYLLFPLMVTGLRDRPRWLLGMLCLALAVAEFHVLTVAGDARGGVLAVERGFSGFSLGMSLRLLIGAVRVRSALPVAVGEIAALTGMVVAALDEWPALIPLCGAALIGLLWFNRGPIARVLSMAVPLWLGRVSFSVYMLHDPVIRMLRNLLPLHRIPLPMPWAGWLYTAGCVVLILLCASATYRWIEQPGRRIPHRLRWVILPATRVAPVVMGARPGASQ